MKLKIDIKPEDQVIPLEQGYIYRWDRIIYTAIAAVALLALIGTGLFKLLSPDQVEPTLQPTTISAAPSETEAPAQARTASTEPSPYFRDDETASDSGESAASETTDEAAQPADNMAAVSPPTVSAQEPESATAAINPAADTGEEQTMATASSPALATAAAPAATAEPAAEPAKRLTDDKGKPFTGLSTEVYSDKIKRFVITDRVRDKEPVGTLSDITLNNNEVATIYAYSEALNFKDDTLRYVWTLNGEKVAEVKVPVWSARWRSYSSKFVTSGMRGDWQVELRDQRDELLAVSEFQY